jgi:hypothetical protein
MSMFKKVEELNELLRYIRALDQDEGIMITNEEKIYITKYSFDIVVVIKKVEHKDYISFKSVEDLKKFLEEKIKFPVEISFY